MHLNFLSNDIIRIALVLGTEVVDNNRKEIIKQNSTLCLVSFLAADTEDDIL